MILQILNQTQDERSYLGGNATVAATGSLTVPITQIFPIARDPQLLSDCANGYVILSDSVNNYETSDAISYMNTIALSLGGAVVGYAGSSAPSFEITIGGKDSSGKSQPARMNQFSDIAINYRNTFINLTGNATTTVKAASGTLHSVLINNNSTGGSVTLYDNSAASGTIIATIQCGSPSGGLISTTGIPNPTFLGPMGLEFDNGLTVVTSGSTNNDITIIYQ